MYYYQHHIGDYRRDTQHLTLLEHGVYRQLLDLYYITEKPIDANALRLICARSAEEIEATKQILAEFFTLEDGVYYHNRCEDEIARFHSKSEKAAASAKARWNKINDLDNANALRSDSVGNANHKPKTNNQEPNILLAQKTKRGSQISIDFKPNEQHIKLANDLGILIEPEFDKFRDYCTAKGATYKDWDAAFRNWLRNASRYTHSVKPTTTKARHSFKDVDYGESGKI